MLGRTIVVAALTTVAAAAPAAAGHHATFNKTLAAAPQVGHPQGAAMDASGNLFVADTHNDRVARFDSAGAVSIIVANQAGQAPQLTDPFNIVIESNGNLVVSDAGQDEVQRFDPTGNLLSTSPPMVGGKSFLPTGIASLGDQGFIVLDAANLRALRFAGGPGDGLDDAGRWSVLVPGGPGTGPGQFFFPAFAVTLGGDRLVISDPPGSRLQMFDAATGAFLAETGTPGTGVGQFQDPEGLTVRPNGDLLVADSSNDRLQVFPGQAAAGVRTFVLPHVLEREGSMVRPGCTFDTTIFATYTGGIAICNAAGGGPGQTGGTVDLYLFDQHTGQPQSPADPGQPAPVCNPCTSTPTPSGDDGARKRALRLDGLVRDARSNGATCSSQVRLGFGVIVVCGGDPGNVNLQGFIVNSHTNVFDVSVFGFEPQPLSADASASVAAKRRLVKYGRRVRVPAGEVRAVELKPPRSLAAALRRAIKRRGKVRRRVQVKFTDTATKRSVTIKRSFVQRGKRKRS